MRHIGDAEANGILSHIGMKIGSWGQVCDASDGLYGKSDWLNHRAPLMARELYVFAQHIARWIPPGDWKIFRIDDSTTLSPDQAFVVWRMLFGQIDYSEWSDHRTFLFEFGNPAEDAHEDLLLNNVMYFFLLFEGHCEIVSSSCADGKSLSLQDGYAYFASRNNVDLVNARALLQTFEEAPLRKPCLLE
jgi:hypothetical protein